MANAIMTIAPYRFCGTWVFDDAAKGLNKEPFIAGIPQMIDGIIKDIACAAGGFRLLFSAMPFPGSQTEVNLIYEENGGGWYRQKGTEKIGWLCPAIFKYFENMPASIYLKAEAL